MSNRTTSYRDLDRRVLWHPYSKHSLIQSQPFPVITHGQGVYLYDSDGRQYVDAISSWWACNLGHGHPRLIRAMQQQAQTLQHSILGNLSHPRAIELAERLVDLCRGSRRVFFAGDGASAVEAALKISVQYWANRGRPEKCRFASLEDAYHGDTLGAVAVGYLDGFHRPFKPLLFPVYRAESPCCGTCRRGGDPRRCGIACFESMGTIIRQQAASLAAVILEPLCQGSAGMRIYAADYLKQLAVACRDHEVLLIVDEIATGFGRTGRMFAYEHAGIDPDIVCLGKGLSGGYLPLSATVVKNTVVDTFTDQPGEDHTFYHGHTFAGNPIACATALETLSIYEDEAIVEQADRLGGLLRDRMMMLKDLPNVTNVRCLGMIAAVELRPETAPQSGIPAPEIIRRRLIEQGVLIRPLGRVLYLMMPLITPEPVLMETVDRLSAAIKEAMKADMSHRV